MDKKGKKKAKFFGFPLSKGGAQIVYILGILLLIGTSISLLWMIYSFITMSAAYAAWGVSGYYTAGYLTYIIPWLVIEIGMVVLAFYMINCGRKGR